MPLSLRTYFFPRISITANSDYEKQPDGYDEKKCEFFGNLEFEDGSTLTGNFMLDMSSEGDEHIPYDIEVQAFAAFTVHDDLTVQSIPYIETFDSRVDTLKRSAIGMVYGAMREFVASTSGRQPWGPFLIPTIIPNDANVDLALSEELKGIRKSLPSFRKVDASVRKAALKQKAPAKAISKKTLPKD